MLDEVEIVVMGTNLATSNSESDGLLARMETEGIVADASFEGSARRRLRARREGSSMRMLSGKQKRPRR